MSNVVVNQSPATNVVVTQSGKSLVVANAATNETTVDMPEPSEIIIETPGTQGPAGGVGGGGGSGDVVGPASATDNALVRYDATTGKLIQNSNAILSDAGALTLAAVGTGSGSAVTTDGTQTLTNKTISIDQATETAGLKILTAAERTKLTGIETGATANQTDAFLLNRDNHTGLVPASETVGFHAVAESGDYNDLGNIPSTFTPSAHNHAAVDINSGVLATARLGTGTQDSTTFLRGDGTWSVPTGSGDVVGPSSSTDNTVARFDSTTGKLIQSSSVLINDNGQVIAFGGYGGFFANAVDDTTRQAFLVKVIDDTGDRFNIFADGKHNWGSGTGATDTNFYRNSAGVLKTDGNILIGTVGTASGSVVTIDGTQTLTNKSITAAQISNFNTAADARISAAVGVSVQAYDADLATLAGLTATTDNFIVSVASAWASRTPAQVRTTLGLVIGTNVQAWDADLDTWATKTAPSGTVVGTTDAQTLTNKTITSPAGLVKGDVGLGNVDNTSDATKNAASVTLTNKTIALGSNTVSGTTAQFNTALTDGDFATLAGTETLTNKIVALGSNTVSGTKAQFDTAVTDGNFLYVGDVTQYTDELAQDAVAAMVVDTATIDFTYTDATPELKADVKDDSITYAKIQNISATSRILGRITAGAGDTEELTGANVRTILGTGTQDSTTFLRGDGTWAVPAGGGTGDVVGPSSATDNALVRFDSTTGKLVQNSNAILTDAGALTLAVAGTAAGSVVTIDGTQTLTNKTIAVGQVTGLATVATSGAYGDLSGTSNVNTLDTTQTISATKTFSGGDTSGAGSAGAAIIIEKTAGALIKFNNTTAAVIGLIRLSALGEFQLLSDNALGYRNLKAGNLYDNDNRVATQAGTETLTNKTFALGSNTFSGTTAQFNTALTDNDFATIAGTETLTNKRITKRTGTTASSATPTINTDNVDLYSITALAAAITSFTTNLSGTPTEGQSLIITITDNGTARAITWGASFESSSVALPTTTQAGIKLTVGFVWNSTTSKWRCVAVA